MRGTLFHLNRSDGLKFAALHRACKRQALHAHHCGFSHNRKQGPALKDLRASSFLASYCPFRPLYHTGYVAGIMFIKADFQRFFKRLAMISQKI